MSLSYWLEKAISLAVEEEQRIKREIEELWQFVPLEKTDIKKYLAISTDERMKRNSELTDKLVGVQMDIGELQRQYYFAERNNKI